MTNSRSCSDGRWSTRADALLGIEGTHVRSVRATGRGLVLDVETVNDFTGCPDCGVVAVGHSRVSNGCATKHDTSVSALTHQLGVSRHTVWDAMKAEATRRLSTTGSLIGVRPDYAAAAYST